MRTGILWVWFGAFCLGLLSGCGGSGLRVDEATAAGVLLVGNGPEPEGIDPLFTTSTSALQIQQALFEGLVTPNPEDLSPEPGVAEHWEHSEDGRTWRFFIRPEARWSNGDRVTAHDFVAGWQRMLEPEGGAPNASLFYIITGAEAYNRGDTTDFGTVGIVAESPDVLRVELRYAAPYFTNLLSHPAFSPVPVDVVKQFGELHDRGNRWSRPENFVGNGPFVLTEWRPNQYLAVERSETYWDRDVVQLKAIRFFAIEDLSAEERAFQGGQLHVTEALPPNRIGAWREGNGESLRVDPYLGVYYILLNHRVSPLDRVEVRRALSQAIDREAITGQLLDAGQLPAKVFTPPNLPDYTPPSLVAPDEAADSLGGYALTYLFNTSESHRKIAEAMAANWSERLDLSVRLENVETRTYFDRRATGNFQMARASWIGDYVDAMTFLALWRTGGGGSEWSGWQSAQYDALLEAANRSGSVAERAERLRQAEALLLEEQVMIPLYHYVTAYLLRPEVTGWHPTILDWHPWKHVGLQ